MKKFKFIATIVCIIMLLACTGCNSTTGSSTASAGLIYDKKYYAVASYDGYNVAKSKGYIVFYKDGTGEYYDYTATAKRVKFKYLLTEDTVHLFYDSALEGDCDPNWNKWYWVKKGVLCSEYYHNTFINEEYLNNFPNFGK